MRIAVSMGDPRGIGPEVILEALRSAPADWQVQVYGAPAVFRRRATERGLGLGMERLLDGSSPVQWVQAGPELDEDRAPEALTEVEAGALQVAALEQALEAVLRGRAEALCTGPITKAAARAAGFPFPGHTEFLAHRCGVSQVAMMLAGPSLRVVPITGHLPLREVSPSLTATRVAQVLCLTALGLSRDFGLAHPRIVLAGLNPHAGERGMLGDEERRVLAPGLALALGELRAQGQGAELAGPLPADGLFLGREHWDAVVTCTHDQAMIPIKILHPDDAVNVTLGLPIVRTSPAHGSAMDIAGRGVARAESMVAALHLAAAIATRRAASIISP